MSIIKQLATYDGSAWTTDDIGANASNVSLTTNVAGQTNVQSALSKIVGTSALTADRAVITGTGGVLSTSTVTNTELSYLSGATSNIQTQINTLNNNLGDIMNEPGVVLIESDQPKQDKILPGLIGGCGYQIHRTDLNLGVSLGIGSGGINHGISSIDSTKGVSDWIIYYTRSNQVAHIPHKLVLENHSTEIGSFLSNSNSSAISIPPYSSSDANVAKAITSISLPPGSWFVVGSVRFDSAAAGSRRCNLSQTANDTIVMNQVYNGGTSVVNLQVCQVYKLNSQTTYYLNAAQASGSTITCPSGLGWIHAIRIA